jgi:hypothetical protein
LPNARVAFFLEQQLSPLLVSIGGIERSTGGSWL